MRVSHGLAQGRLRRLNRRRKKKADASAAKQEMTIVGVGGYTLCSFRAESPCDCDLCLNASPGSKLFAATSSAGEGGEETDHYACPSCALAKAEQIRTDQEWWRSAVECPACAAIARQFAFDLMPPQCAHCVPYGLVSPAKAESLRARLAEAKGRSNFSSSITM